MTIDDDDGDHDVISVIKKILIRNYQQFTFNEKQIFHWMVRII